MEKTRLLGRFKASLASSGSIADMAKGICKLCGVEADLRKSHIFLEFIIRWMKGSGTPYLRRSGNPNKREQDGLKEQLLCEQCEQKFSRDENSFSNRIFRPYLAGERGPFIYDMSLHNFLASLLWRVLLVDLDPKYIGEDHRFYKEYIAALESWRLYLNGGLYRGDLPEIHIFLTDIGFLEGSQPVVNWNSYMARMIDSTLASSERQCFVYAKFARFLVFGALTQFEPGNWVNTRIDPMGGTLLLPQEMRDGSVGEFLLDRASTANEMIVLGTSDKQREVIKKAAKTQPGKFLKSDLAAVLYADHVAQVEPTTLWPGAKENGRCPCGSGKAYEHCHGEGEPG
jgi:hypothetical protein